MLFPRANSEISHSVVVVFSEVQQNKKNSIYGRVGENLRCKATCVARSCWRLNFILQQWAWQPEAAAICQGCRRSWPFSHPRLLRRPQHSHCEQYLQGEKRRFRKLLFPACSCGVLGEVPALPSPVLLAHGTPHHPQCQQCFWAGTGLS